MKTYWHASAQYCSTDQSAKPVRRGSIRFHIRPYFKAFKVSAFQINAVKCACHRIKHTAQHRILGKQLQHLAKLLFMLNFKQISPYLDKVKFRNAAGIPPSRRFAVFKPAA
ncbi:hypothetical protein [Neisseria gonorrhoeae]|uniref:hypothetical protein n=1 Tax=Neisseria gonorrhoeae TaxID=485 RepID=UPI00223FC842|nr:hypothetical protein [Neisseria gonorrhoeae]UYP52465.1 hypothetical protein ND436_002755 [Neisseria gonorrhoeae]